MPIFLSMDEQIFLLSQHLKAITNVFMSVNQWHCRPKKFRVFFSFLLAMKKQKHITASEILR